MEKIKKISLIVLLAIVSVLAVLPFFLISHTDNSVYADSDIANVSGNVDLCLMPGYVYSDFYELPTLYFYDGNAFFQQVCSLDLLIYWRNPTSSFLDINFGIYYRFMRGGSDYIINHTNINNDLSYTPIENATPLIYHELISYSTAMALINSDCIWNVTNNVVGQPDIFTFYSYIGTNTRYLGGVSSILFGFDSQGYSNIPAKYYISNYFGSSVAPSTNILVVTFEDDSEFIVWLPAKANTTDSKPLLAFGSNFYTGNKFFTNDAFNQATLDGFNNGYDEGYSGGYDEGYSGGYDEGYNVAINRPSNKSFEGLVFALFDTPIHIMSSLFSLEILGVNLWSFIVAIFSIMLVVVIIRLITGGGRGEK